METNHFRIDFLFDKSDAIRHGLVVIPYFLGLCSSHPAVMSAIEPRARVHYPGFGSRAPGARCPCDKRQPRMEEFRRVPTHRRLNREPLQWDPIEHFFFTEILPLIREDSPNPERLNLLIWPKAANDYTRCPRSVTQREYRLTAEVVNMLIAVSLGGFPGHSFGGSR